MEEQNNLDCIFTNEKVCFPSVVIRASKRMQIAKVPKDIFDRITSIMNPVQQKLENNVSENQYLQIIRDVLFEEKERKFNRQNNMIRTLKLNGVSGYVVSSIVVIVGLVMMFIIVFMISKAMVS